MVIFSLSPVFGLSSRTLPAIATILIPSVWMVNGLRRGGLQGVGRAKAASGPGRSTDAGRHFRTWTETTANRIVFGDLRRLQRDVLTAGPPRARRSRPCLA